MSGLHAHSQSATPTTEGVLIRQARFYNTVFKWLLQKSEATILSLAGVKPGATVLDVACGPGSLTIAAKKRSGSGGQVYGVDASTQMIEVARHEATHAKLDVNFQVGLAEKLPFEGEKFDVALSRLAFHHLPGELKNRTLDEIYRVLKPGGVCLIVDFEPNSMPGPKFLRAHLSGMHGMMKVDVRQYAPLLEASRFSEIECAPTGHLMLSYVKGRKTFLTQ